MSTAASELSELRETVDDQRSTIESQDKKILDLLQQQESTEKAEHYVKELMLEIQKEKEMVVEKDNEIQTLLEKLETKRSEGDGEDAETKSKKVIYLFRTISFSIFFMMLFSFYTLSIWSSYNLPMTR